MGWIKILPRKKTIKSPGKTPSLRGTVLLDCASDIGIAIWGEFTQSLEEGRKYQFHNLNLQNIFGNKLSTTPTTTAIVPDQIEEMPILSDDVFKKYIDHEEEINIILKLKICYPELVSTQSDRWCSMHKWKMW